MNALFVIAVLLAELAASPATLDWVPVGDGIESFIIMRNLNNGPWEEIATVGPTVRKFIDDKRAQSSVINHYCYEVAAYGKGVLLGTSAAGCKDEPAVTSTVPASPTDLVAR